MGDILIALVGFTIGFFLFFFIKRLWESKHKLLLLLIMWAAFYTGSLLIGCKYLFEFLHPVDFWQSLIFLFAIFCWFCFVSAIWIGILIVSVDD